EAVRRRAEPAPGQRRAALRLDDPGALRRIGVARRGDRVSRGARGHGQPHGRRCLSRMTADGAGALPTTDDHPASDRRSTVDVTEDAPSPANEMVRLRRAVEGTTDLITFHARG